MSSREEQFERMLLEIKRSYVETSEILNQLKDEHKTKTIRYRELLSLKLMYAEMISLYKSYGLSD